LRVFELRISIIFKTDNSKVCNS